MLTNDPTPCTALPAAGHPAAIMLPPQAPQATMGPPTEAPPGTVVSLVCGLLSLLCCGIPVVGLVLGIIAMVSAGRARAAVQAQPLRYIPSGMATGGLVTGIIGTVLNSLVILFWTVVILLIAIIANAIHALVGGGQASALPGPML